LKGLPGNIDDNTLWSVFGQYGTVSSVKVLPMSDGRTDASALVRMGSAQEASWLVQNVNGNIPQGMAVPVHISLAVKKDSGDKGGAKGGWGGGWSSPAQSWGKGSWGGGFGGGWGKGKGKGKRRTDPEKTVWIGGLPENEASKERNMELLEHMKQAGDCKFVSIGRTGQGSAKFTSAEEVATAIATLNGSTFQGHVIEVDVWTKKEE